MNSLNIYSKIFTIVTMLLIHFGVNAQDYHLRGTVENSNIEISIESVDSTEVPSFEVNLHPNDEPYYTIKFTEEIPVSGSFRIRMDKVEQIPNGTSTLDLVLIMRYILAIGSFETQAQLLASDINQDGKVSVIDLIRLRRWILGIDVDNRWKFFDRDPHMIDIHESNPDLLPVDFYEIEYNSLPIENIDFFGIKLGDVNNTALSN